MKSIDEKVKKWQRPGRVPIGGQVEKWMFDKVCEVANNNNISRTKVLEDALDCYFNERTVEIEKEVIKEVERPKTEFEIDIKDLPAEHLGAILEISKKHNLNYLKSIELIINFLIKRAGAVEADFVAQAINIIKNK